MAIEALGGAMSYQAQPVVKPQVAAPQPVTMEGQMVETNPMVDANTAAVAQVSEQDEFQNNQQNHYKSADNYSFHLLLPSFSIMV